MAEPKVHDLSYFACALLLGILANALIRGAEWGVNITLWLLAVFAVVSYFRHQQAYPKLGYTVFVALAFAFLFSWRDSPVLHWLAIGAIAAAVCFATLGRDRRPALLDYAGVIADAIATAPILVLRRFPIAARSVRRVDIIHAPMVERILRGLLLSLVPLVVFGWLFFAADAAFENLVVDVFTLDPSQFGRMLIFVTALSMVALLALYLLTCGPLVHVNRTPLKTPKSLGSIEINVVLCVVNALFLVFLALQIESLFGGHERVLNELGLTYAEYAQRGFYELCAVTALAFSMLLVLRAMMPPDEPRAGRVFVALGEVHIVLAAILAASALHRLGLYMDVYGLTEARLYAAAGIVWMVLSFAALAVALLRKSSVIVPWVMTRSAFAVVFVLFAINPDGLIARTNLGRAAQGKTFDVEYAAGLSADAVPALILGLNDLTAADSAALRARLVDRWSGEYAYPVHEFNLARLFAGLAVRSLS